MNKNALREKGAGEAEDKVNYASNASAASQKNNVEFTLITSTKPSVLSKKYSVDVNGELIKETSANMVEGSATPTAANSLADFSKTLANLRRNQALCFGLPVTRRAVNLVTKEKWRSLGKPDNPQPRTKEAFLWAESGGVMLLDYDPNDDSAMSRDDLIQAIREAVPGLTDASMLWWPSSSSHIFNGDNDLTGLRGQRIYILVKDAIDIPRAGDALVNHLWAAGFGYIEISKAGRLLERCPVDATVWQPNRLDFAAGAICKPPFEQRRGDPVIIPGSVEFVDTSLAIPDPCPKTISAAKNARSKAKLLKKPDADQVREVWLDERVAKITAGTDSVSDEMLQHARTSARRAIETGTLSGDYIITVIENGERIDVSVGEILDDPARFHNVITLDPIEPDYLNYKQVGKIFLYSARPTLYSFAHGGQAYKLLRQPRDIERVQGRTHDAVLASLELLRQAPEIFDFGDSISLVDGGKVHPLDQDHLSHWLGGASQFWGWRINRDGTRMRRDVDPPVQVCRAVLSMGRRRNLKQLDAVIAAPTLRPDGSVLARPGYDPHTRLLVEIDELITIPDKPTCREIEDALDTLMTPFNDFPLVNPLDWGVLLSALLTAVVRPTLPTAPAFAFDAPVQGSGKTLLAKCILALSTGEEPDVWGHSKGRDDEEARKRIFTVLRDGKRGIIWDNVTGIFDSASVASLLTSSSYTDRVLGRTESTTVPNRAMFILTGNNITLAGDMPRRVLTCRIDPKCESPHARRFTVDPLNYVLNHHIEMSAAALTLIRGWLTSYESGIGVTAKGRMASFEKWDDFVRQTVAWIVRNIDSDSFAVIAEAQSADPEQEALGEFLIAMEECFCKNKWVSTADIMKRINCFSWNDDEEQRLMDATRDLIGNIPNSTKSLGRVLKFRKDRIVSGMRLESKRDTQKNSMLWRVTHISN